MSDSRSRFCGSSGSGPEQQQQQPLPLAPPLALPPPEEREDEAEEWAEAEAEADAGGGSRAVFGSVVGGLLVGCVGGAEAEGKNHSPPPGATLFALKRTYREGM